MESCTEKLILQLSLAMLSDSGISGLLLWAPDGYIAREAGRVGLKNVDGSPWQPLTNYYISTVDKKAWANVLKGKTPGSAAILQMIYDQGAQHGLSAAETIRIINRDALPEEVISETMANKIRANGVAQGLDEAAITKAIEDAQPEVSKRAFQFHKSPLNLPPDILMKVEEALPAHYRAAMAQIYRHEHFNPHGTDPGLMGLVSQIKTDIGPHEGQYAYEMTRHVYNGTNPLNPQLQSITNMGAKWGVGLLGSWTWADKHIFQILNNIGPNQPGLWRMFATQFTKEGRQLFADTAPFIPEADTMSILSFNPDEAQGSPMKTAGTLWSNLRTGGLPRLFRFEKGRSAGFGKLYARDMLDFYQGTKDATYGTRITMTKPEIERDVRLATGKEIHQLDLSNPQIRDQVENAWAHRIAEDNFPQGGNPLLTSPFLNTWYGRMLSFLNQYEMRQWGWFWNESIRMVRDNPRQLGPLAEMIAFKLAGGYAANVGVQAIKSAFGAVAQSGMNFQQFLQLYAINKQTNQMDLLTDIGTGFASWPVSHLISLWQYGKGNPTTIARDTPDEMVVPVAISLGAQASKFPVYAGNAVHDWLTGDLSGTDAYEEFGAGMTRTGLGLFLPSYMAKPLEQKASDKWWAGY